ncbi:BQ2448_6819 [Microbotryum intermedium]|uniref:BQ2448_6819 protein n=1 Tax=Microbotryum intermedium TaxID=269621 RepID=A0A238FM84_9BASI|nr:BQ2448_6819 [Microbotryum intermedium]
MYLAHDPFHTLTLAIPTPRGIKDLATTLSKHVPSSITPLRSLSLLQGQTVAIDASVLTSKLHFSRPTQPHPPSSQPVPIPDHSDGENLSRTRIVQGWYTFLRALCKAGIKPIVVFDGPTRVPAKAKENRRRVEARELQKDRSGVEWVRGERLRETLRGWTSVREEEWNEVRKRFRESVLSDFHDAQAEGEESSSVSHLTSDQLQIEPLDLRTHSTSTSQSSPLTTPTPLLDRTEPLPDAVLTTVLSLTELHARFQADTMNTIYSKNQTLVTEAERQWYDSILVNHDHDRIDADHEAQNASFRIYTEGLEMILRQSAELERSHRTRAEAVPWQASEDVLNLIRSLGVPYLKPSPTSPYEAEALCASLYHAQLVSLIISEDTDVIIYQAPLLRRVNSAGQDPSSEADGEYGSGKGMSVWDAEKAREGLGLRRDEMVDFALLCGSDFTERIPKLGPARALELIRNYGSIETILTSQSRYLPSDPSTYLLSVQAARQIFNDIPTLSPQDHLTLVGRDATLDDDPDEFLRRWGIKGGVLRFDGVAWPSVEEMNDREGEGEEWILWEEGEDDEVVGFGVEQTDWEMQDEEVEPEPEMREKVGVVAGKDTEDEMARLIDGLEIDDDMIVYSTF